MRHHETWIHPVEVPFVTETISETHEIHPMLFPNVAMRSKIYQCNLRPTIVARIEHGIGLNMWL